MSADLVLYAGPNEPEWIAKWNAYLGNLTEYLSPDELDECTWDYLLLAELTQGCSRCWIGQVSWAGALLGEKDCIPAPVLKISEYMGDGRVLTSGVAEKIQTLMNLPNRSIYGRRTIHYFHDPAEYRRTLEANRNNGQIQDLGHGLIAVRKPENNSESGICRRRELKRWLRANIGRYVVALSE